MDTVPQSTEPAQSKTRKPKERPPLLLDAFIRTIPPAGGHPGCALLTLASPGKRKGVVEVVAYVLQVNGVAEGLAYRLVKLLPSGTLAGETYDVLLVEDDKDQPADTCDCKGHERWKKCKHVLGMRRLLGEGALPTV
jgi:hypothetical protein